VNAADRFQEKLNGYTNSAKGVLGVRGNSQLVKTAAMTAVAGASMAMAPAADAAISYSGLVNTTISGVGASAILDLDSDSNNDIKFNVESKNSWGADLVVNATGVYGGGAIGPGPVSNLAPGYSVNSGGVFSWNWLAYSSGALGQFPGITGYIGVSFGNAGGTHYGWIQVSVPANADGITIIDYAYETDPGIGILVGAVPEPGSAGLVGLGLLAMGAGRSRRRKGERPSPSSEVD